MFHNHQFVFTQNTGTHILIGTNVHSTYQPFPSIRLVWLLKQQLLKFQDLRHVQSYRPIDPNTMNVTMGKTDMNIRKDHKNETSRGHTCIALII